MGRNAAGPDDPGLRADLFVAFLHRSEGDIVAMRRALAAGDLAVVRHLAHRMAGAAGAFGLQDTSDRARLLEGRCAQGTAEELDLDILRLGESLPRAGA